MDTSQRTAPAAPSAAAVTWHALSPEAVLEELSTTEQGLTSDEAARRLVEHGRNELDFTQSRPWWYTLIKQFFSPVIALLTVAAIISAIQQHWVDAVAILLVLIINAALGFWQERKAEADVRALASLSTPSCRVLREGQERVIPAPEVVPGDVVLLESGERVPADLRLIEVNALAVDESMLTGESQAATKRAETLGERVAIAGRTNMAFSGTLVTRGRAVAVVTATGAATELGEINRLVQGPSGKSPLQILTHGLERRIGVLVLLAVIFVFGAGLVMGHDPSDMFRTAVALAVASIPESLPIVLTVAMSVGVSRMARRHAVLRTLPAVETLGSTTVIGSDKTGTLTQNLLTVERLWTARGTVELSAGSEPAEDTTMAGAVLRAGALTNEATPAEESGRVFQGDAVDVAMMVAAIEQGALSEQERSRDPLAHTPYEPDLRYSQSVHEEADGRRVLYVKGSPDTLLEMSEALAGGPDGGHLDTGLVLEANEGMAADGLRVIATAMRVLDPGEQVSEPLPTPAGLTFLGLEGMVDPPRPGVAEAVAACRRAGIAVAMITGDQPVTASSIAARLGMDTGGEPLTGLEMEDLDDARLAARLHETGVAARVTPQDKLRIVRVLQDRDEVVAVTGDGVNDAPALKAAAIGVAMGKSGTDVAREAADLVLTDDNFVTIVHAVEQGRVTFAAIRKATFFLLSTGFAALLAMSINVLTDQPLLFLPVQMLWINLVTNGVQDIALALEPAEGNELDNPPRPRSEGLLSRTLWFRTAITGGFMSIVVLLTFWWGLENGLSDEHARSLALTMFVLLNFFQVMSARAQYRSLFSLSPLGNKPLLFTSLGALVLHWAVMAWPVSSSIMELTSISPLQWLACVVVGSSVLFLVEAEKAVRRWSRRRAASATGGGRGTPGRAG